MPKPKEFQSLLLYFPGLLRSIPTLNSSTLSCFPLGWFICSLRGLDILCVRGVPKNHGSFNVPAGTRLSLTCFGACNPGQTTQHRLALARITRFLPLVSIFSERLSEGFRQWNEYPSSTNTCYIHDIVHDRTSTSYTNTYTMRH